MKKELSSTAPYIVKLINTMGKAGSNEVYNINLENIEGKNIKYNIKFETKKEASNGYHYYDHSLTINSSDNRNLKIDIIPQEVSDEFDHYYNTKILVTYMLLNGTEFKIESFVNGWNYENIVNFSEENYYNKTIYDRGKTLLEVVSELMSHLKSFYNKEELDNLLKIFNQEVDYHIKKNEANLKEAEELLETLSEEQIYCLKKVLGNRNKRK